MCRRRRLLRGDISVAAVRRTLGALAAVVLRRVRGGGEVVDAAALALDELGAQATDVVLAFSGDEALEAKLRADGTLAAAESGRWPDVTLARLPGMDHSLRPLPAQHAAAALVAAALERAGRAQPGVG